MNTDAQHCYETLGLTPGADQDQIKKAWRELANQWHPDKVSHNPKLQSIAQEEMKSINAAYEFLKLHPQIIQADTERQRTKGQSAAAAPPPSKHTVHNVPALRPILRPAPKSTHSKSLLHVIIGVMGSVICIVIFVALALGFLGEYDTSGKFDLLYWAGAGSGCLAYACFGRKKP